SRAARQARYPARFQLVAAMNPCPCGWSGAFAATGRTCRCSPDAVSRYQSRLSGPLLDRIDMLVEVPAVRPAELLAAADVESSAEVALRVARAQAVQRDRQGSLNARLDAGALDRHCALSAPATQFIRAAAERLNWSGRSLHRVIKLARSVADLAASSEIEVPHIAEAVHYRRALGPSV
ncbi:ATP-binding protein, partial [Ideonella sp.]|uniref:magnesium chelatase subunit ChlI family protein n=1 Tax=Ideonella sp. TaxID=1929293 RepID=UPI003BB80483